KTSLELFVKIGNGEIENAQLKEFANNRSNSFYNFFKSTLRKKSAIPTYVKEEPLKYDLLVFGKDEEKLNYKSAKCCTPIPGDKVFGFITINEGLKIHKLDCPNTVALQANYSYRILQAKWVDSSQQTHKVSIRLKGVDNRGLVSDVTKTLNDLNVNLHGINLSGDEGFFEGKIIIEINNKDQLKTIIMALKKVDGVVKVVREHK
ncbi:MAG TPA: bifunctional (p)ppGpp synthetase/guanosine-3',5'-bis(diphosphate) 3'-pyrophosphohydrolase, partial [Flavobacteriaceae bacterium]|nr:bifunctional (p)ppGpp synthetase/guanosine-3',5'-bis(diphosphate) 3'-pyrophosphohydrolase [Flavobacteriaceae bacterium]